MSELNEKKGKNGKNGKGGIGMGKNVGNAQLPSNEGATMASRPVMVKPDPCSPANL